MHGDLQERSATDGKPHDSYIKLILPACVLSSQVTQSQRARIRVCVIQRWQDCKYTVNNSSQKLRKDGIQTKLCFYDQLKLVE